MTTIQITIDILNPNEVVEKHRGRFIEAFANLFMDKGKLKREVEEKVCREIIKQLQEMMPEALEKNGVKANIFSSINF